MESCTVCQLQRDMRYEGFLLIRSAEKRKDSKGNDIARGAIGLRDLVTVDTSDLIGKDVSVTVACDVTNPLCGPDGASFVYGPQKGASPATCAEMDSYLRHFASVAGFSSYEAGTGAAGGMTALST